MHLNEKSVKALQSLKRHPWSEDRFQTTKRSAVLVALIANAEGDLEVILTVRSSFLRTNAGDSAFPGGKRDPEDIDLTATAKREAFEEVRLSPSESQTLTFLPPVLSRHMQVVTPVVVYCPRMTTKDLPLLCPNPGEVSAIFTAPLESFLSPRPEEYHWFDMKWVLAEHRVHRFERCGAKNYIIGETDKSLEDASRLKDEEKDSFHVDRSKVGWPVYGLTAGVLIEVAKIAYEREPDFQAYAPEQVLDAVQLAEWYNQRHGPARSSL